MVAYKPASSPTYFEALFVLNVPGQGSKFTRRYSVLSSPAELSGRSLHENHPRLGVYGCLSLSRQKV